VPVTGRPGAPWEAVLASQVVDRSAVNELAGQRYDAFVAGRNALIETLVRAFLLRMAEWRTEDTPPLADLDLDLDDAEFEDRVEGAGR